MGRTTIRHSKKAMHQLKLPLQSKSKRHLKASYIVRMLCVDTKGRGEEGEVVDAEVFEEVHEVYRPDAFRVTVLVNFLVGNARVAHRSR